LTGPAPKLLSILVKTFETDANVFLLLILFKSKVYILLIMVKNGNDTMALPENVQKVKDSYDQGLRTNPEIENATGLGPACINNIRTQLRKEGYWTATPIYGSRKGVLNSSTMEMIEEMKLLLKVINPQSVRQIFYGLVVKELIENTKNAYASVSGWVTTARLKGMIPWDYVVDRTRTPQRLNMYEDLEDFARYAAYWYRSNWWKDQEQRIIFWCEKDALSGVIWPVVKDYGVPLYVGKGFDSWSSIKDAADDFGTGENVTILYAGDLDTAGVFINQSLMNRLAKLGCHPTMERIALNPEHIEKWDLKASYAKRSLSKEQMEDGEGTHGERAWCTRVDKFVKEYGDIAVELDAIPPLEFRKLIKEEIENRIDLPALRVAQAKDECAKERIQEAIEDVYLDDCGNEEE
jgi:hypothetical protein